MDVSSIANTASATQQGSISQQASVAVLKQALELEANTGAQLIKMVQASNLPANLGQNINVAV